ncbi:glycosyltransferase [Flavobacterium rhizosphaerae]|uniref:Glycosyltransferase n=1 Tax=Flavobacterium rhizosphaerae TaxID=3163298 RepID=A0ABW8YUE6_9FLAO
MYFSLVIPVYNRPHEVRELLESLSQQDYGGKFEVVIVEDGSAISSREIVETFSGKLFLSYYYKQNTGPGDSRNYGMEKAKGDYFIILDSDCIIPPGYLTAVAQNLQAEFVHCFGGPDAALDSFSNVQKAINFSMTSFITTGGVRGKTEKISKFQPRSFNMGLSRQAFEATGGFGNIHPGEDPDLALRLWKMGYKTKLFTNAYVYHKRRIDWYKFYMQVNKFGKVRPILDQWHPEYRKITYLFPALFFIGFICSVLFLLIHVYFPLYLYILYFIMVFVISAVKNKSLKIGMLSVPAAAIQFYGYGRGYIEAFVKIVVLKKQPQNVFPTLFFKKND